MLQDAVDELQLAYCKQADDVCITRLRLHVVYWDAVCSGSDEDHKACNAVVAEWTEDEHDERYGLMPDLPDLVSDSAWESDDSYKLTRHTPFGRLAMPPSEPQPDPETTPQALKERWEAAKQPLKTGVFANKWLVDEPVPYFRSGATQHTSDEHKDLKLALFTGEVRDGVAPPLGYRASRGRTEVPQIWKPHETASATPLGFSGSAAGALQLAADARLRLHVPRIQNNVNPVGAPVQVHPDRDPLLRVMPINPSLKMPGKLQGLTPVGFSAATTERLPQPMSVSAALLREGTVMPVLGGRGAAPPSLQAVAQGTRDSASVARPMAREVCGAAHAPALAGQQLLLRAELSAAPAVAASRRGVQQQAGQLAFGSRSNGPSAAAATFQGTIRRQPRQQQQPMGTLINSRVQHADAATERVAFSLQCDSRAPPPTMSTTAASEGFSFNMPLTLHQGDAMAQSAPCKRQQQPEFVVQIGQARALPTHHQPDVATGAARRMACASSYEPAATRCIPAHSQEEKVPPSMQSRRRAPTEWSTSRSLVPALASEDRFAAMLRHEDEEEQQARQQLKGRRVDDVEVPTGQARAMPPSAVQADLGSMEPSSRASAAVSIAPVPSRTLVRDDGATRPFDPRMAHNSAERRAGASCPHEPSNRATMHSAVRPGPAQQTTGYRKVPSSSSSMQPLEHHHLLTKKGSAPAAAEATAMQCRQHEHAADQSTLLINAGVRVPSAPVYEAPELLSRFAEQEQHGERMMPEARMHAPLDQPAPTAAAQTRKAVVSAERELQPAAHLVRPLAVAAVRPAAATTAVPKRHAEAGTQKF
ncbi:hypothetical protein OEZ85_011034 [Tetradesmus obliquus]|uniref:Uncharacterized protein n=1 Tax=Tetradesmus obliquus TaxID=3088 RepID=A0ABY8TR52_TETOB|nr:hypothetical protein OEZ85_011034 [Tetradesmus obliquus]